jgi:hypothetical protein
MSLGPLVRAACVGWLLAVGGATAAEPGSGQQAAWPGLPPDCWTEPRLYLTDTDDWNWPSRTKIERIAATAPLQVTRAPNRVYSFAVQGEAPRQSVLIFAEQPRAIRISFNDPRGLAEVKWLNEKLLYLRVWWGRVAATDLFFDVEQARVVLAQSVHDGADAMQQYQEGCRRMGGCQCVQRDAR